MYKRLVAIIKDRSGKESTAQDRGRETNNLREDIVYVPQDSFPAIHGNFSHNYNDLICCTYKYFIYLQL